MRKLMVFVFLSVTLVLAVSIQSVIGKQDLVEEVTLPVVEEVVLPVAEEVALKPVEMAAVSFQDAGSASSITKDPEIPFLIEWLSSGHADVEAEAFIHWNEDDPAVVPTTCARCHSTPGYQAYIGADGSEPGIVETDVPTGTVISCVACHNNVTIAMDSVVMPSGLELTGLGDEARCMQCHQGRHSTVSVDESITEAAVTDEDAVSEDLAFLNIHYYAAAASKYGTLAKGGYEYEGKTYDAFFSHVPEYDSCIECHNSHTLELKLDECSTCHEDVTSNEDLQDIRMAGSVVDYDGDGDVEEGIYHELAGMRDMLYEGIQAYASTIVDTPIVYDPASYPYFFIDTNADGATDGDEAAYPNRYNAWTARLLKAAYNYQTSLKDPGAFAHGGKYHIQLMYDSIDDLNSAIAEAVDLSEAHRVDAGHFAGSEEPFRHWDEDGAVPGSCAKCHTGTGLPMFLQEGVTISQPPANGFLCTTCHNDLQEFTRYEVDQVKFPSGAVIDIAATLDALGDDSDADARNNSNLCMNCHQGRESGVSVDRLTEGIEDDAVSDKLRFLNIHYFAAGATRFGTEANGAYEYADKEYIGFFEHANVNNCTDCHGAHSLEVEWESCTECHEEVETKEDIRSIRYYFTDWDGNGDSEEGLDVEISNLRDQLYVAMQEYASSNFDAGIIYTTASYPYYFVDANGNGEPDEDEINRDNRFNTWTPRLLRAAYNYQYASKDPGAFTHNGQYIVQILQDSLEDLGADVADMTRP